MVDDLMTSSTLSVLSEDSDMDLLSAATSGTGVMSQIIHFIWLYFLNLTRHLCASLWLSETVILYGPAIFQLVLTLTLSVGTHIIGVEAFALRKRTG